ncbi:nucleoside hydrolase [Lunatimonas lonarensis]|uniref:nucleoside hydrolase n=1 Tax=Lunatimonas lonarensis TaxID=1232681 RepID=UPI0012DD9D32|nr:nucleoside hydrolase [Lunatimonas lonarensis]
MVGTPRFSVQYCFFLGMLFVCYPLLAQQSRVILDTDMDSDVDDVGALAMLHTLADHGRIDLLGVIVTSDDPYAPACTDALNQYFGRPKIPIGVEKGIQLTPISRYTQAIAEEFPSRIKDYEDADHAVWLYRKLLSESPDSSVIVITIGHLTNFAALLRSSPDSLSSLSGADLAHKKIKLWSCMGGMYPKGKEANFYRPDPASTVYAIENWKGRVVFAGWELGNEIITGGFFLKTFLDESSPVWRSYQLYNDFSGRQSWDQASILYAVSPNKGYWDLVDRGRCIVAPDGSNHWDSNLPSSHAYLVKKADPSEVAKIIDALMVGIYRDGF